MAPKDLPPKVAELMKFNGAVVLFGPDYLKNSLLVIEQYQHLLQSVAVLSCEKIDDLRVPDGPALNCSMTFFHRKPPAADFGVWDTALLKGVDLNSQPPQGLGVADKTPEAPEVELVPVDGREMQLILTWRRPLEASHIVKTARALERAYLANGGEYDPPGVFKSLRGLFP